MRLLLNGVPTILLKLQNKFLNKKPKRKPANFGRESFDVVVDIVERVQLQQFFFWSFCFLRNFRLLLTLTGHVRKRKHNVKKNNDLRN